MKFVVLNRFKVVFSGTEKECDDYIFENHIDHSFRGHDIIAVTLANGAKIHYVEDNEYRMFSYRFIYFDFFWKNNDTNTPNMERHPIWYDIQLYTKV